jgi:VCBS repeat-containing protein
VDTKATAGVTVDSITPDNVINAAESGTKVKVTGSVSGDVKDGDTVTLHVNGKDVTGTVSGGQYAIAVDGADLKADTNVHASVTGTDAAGNTATAAVDHRYAVDTAIQMPTIALPHTMDTGVSHSDGITSISKPMFVGDAEPGSHVVIKDAQGTVVATTTASAQGTYSFAVSGALGDGKHTFTVTSTDAAGNTAQGSKTVTIDTTAPDKPIVEIVQDKDNDGVLNGAEMKGASLADVQVSLPPHAEIGDTLTIHVSGHTLHFNVDAAIKAAGSINTPIYSLQEGHSYAVTATLTDKAGNVSQIGKDSVSVDTQASATDDIAPGVTEDKLTHVSGNVLSNDGDAAQVTTTGDLKGQFGSFHFNADGSYTYTLDNTAAKVQGLAPSSTPLSDTVTYKAVDNHGNEVSAQLQVDIHGTIDAPTLTATHEATHFHAIDASAITTSKTHHEVSNMELLAYGSQHITDASGKLDLSGASRSIVNAYRSFGVDSQHKSPFASRSMIETDETLLVHLQGQAQGAQIGLISFDNKIAHPNHYGSDNDKVRWTAFDKDGHQVATGEQAPSSADQAIHATIDIQTSSPFTYIAIQAIDPVGKTGLGYSRFSVSKVDAQLISYDTKIDLAGHLQDLDPGSKEVLSYKITGLDNASGFNKGTHNADGSWTISAKDAQDLHLQHGGDLQLKIEAIATDGSVVATSAPVTLDVNLKNAQYELISGLHTGKTDEDNTHDVGGNLHIDTSAATGQHEFVPDSRTTKHGTFSIDAQGHWTYHVDNAANQYLARTDAPVKETFTVQTNTGVTRDVTVFITGKNDPTILGGKLTGDVTEDKTSATSGKITFSDVDTDVSRIGMRESTRQGSYGTLHIHKDSTWEYTLDHAKTDHLKAGEVVHETFKDPSVLIDGAFKYGERSSGTINIAVHGSNDGAQIGGADHGTVNEGGITAAAGHLTISDVDTGKDGTDHSEEHFVAQSHQAGSNGYGHFTIGADGQWSYSLDSSSSAVKALRAGQHVEDKIEVKSADGTTHEIAVNIAGTDHDPVITGSLAGQVTEDAKTNSISGQVQATDADGDTLHYAIDHGSQAKYGTIDIDSKTGKWTYHLDNSNKVVDALNTGDTLKDSVKVTVDDGHGGKTTKNVDITIDGHTDAPQVQMIQQVFTTNTHTASTFSQGQSTGLYYSRNSGDIVQPIKLKSTAKPGEQVTWHLVGGTLDRFSTSGRQTISLKNANGVEVGVLKVNANGHTVVAVPAYHSSGSSYSSHATDFRPRHTGTLKAQVEVVDSKGNHSAPVDVYIVVDRTGIHSVSIGRTAISDEPLSDLDQANIDVQDADHRITAAMDELHDLQAQGADTSEVQARLVALQAEKAELSEHLQSVMDHDATLPDGTVVQEQAEIGTDGVHVNSDDSAAAIPEPESDGDEDHARAVAGSDLADLLGTDEPLNLDGAAAPAVDEGNTDTDHAETAAEASRDTHADTSQEAATDSPETDTDEHGAADKEAQPTDAVSTDAETHADTGDTDTDLKAAADSDQGDKNTDTVHDGQETAAEAHADTGDTDTNQETATDSDQGDKDSDTVHDGQETAAETHADTGGTDQTQETAAGNDQDGDAPQTADGDTSAGSNGTVAAGDVLDSGGDEGSVDDLLANQPDKEPVPAPDAENSAGANAAPGPDDHTAVDTSTLDSNLVDTPDDHPV